MSILNNICRKFRILSSYGLKFQLYSHLKIASQSSCDIYHTSSASGGLVQSNEVKKVVFIAWLNEEVGHGDFFYFFLVLVCLIHLSWKMKQIRTDTDSGAYYSQLGQTDIVFQASLYFEKFFVLFYFGLSRKGGRTSTGTKPKTKTNNNNNNNKN